MTIGYIILLNRQGKVRLAKWFRLYTEKEKRRIIRDVSQMIIGRRTGYCNFLDYKTDRVIYRRYASLYFAMCADKDDNELIVLETIHLFVCALDQYFGNVCELDVIYNFDKVYYILDEMFAAGELQETSKRAVVKLMEEQDAACNEQLQSETAAALSSGAQLVDSVAKKLQQKISVM